MIGVQIGVRVYKELWWSLRPRIYLNNTCRVVRGSGDLRRNAHVLKQALSHGRWFADTTRSVVLSPPVSAFAVVEDGGPLVGAAELDGGEPNLFPAAFFTGLLRQSLGYKFMAFDRLYARQLLAQRRRKVGWGRSGDDCFGSGVFILSTAAFAEQNIFLTSFGCGQKITAIIAENQSSNGRHVCVMTSR